MVGARMSPERHFFVGAWAYLRPLNPVVAVPVYSQHPGARSPCTRTHWRHGDSDLQQRPACPRSRVVLVALLSKRKGKCATKKGKVA